MINTYFFLLFHPVFVFTLSLGQSYSIVIVRLATGNCLPAQWEIVSLNTQATPSGKALVTKDTMNQFSHTLPTHRSTKLYVFIRADIE